MAKQWYVMRVQSGREEQVIENLKERVRAAGLEDQVSRVLTPTERVSEVRQGEKKVRERKIYPGYIMLEMDLNDATWFLLRETPGLGVFVGPNSRPSPMAAAEVEKVLGEVDRGREEPAKVKIDFKVGDSVKIKEGPFENFDGIVEEVFPTKGTVRVVITIFGRATPVELEYWQVEPV